MRDAFDHSELVLDFQPVQQLMEGGVTLRQPVLAPDGDAGNGLSSDLVGAVLGQLPGIILRRPVQGRLFGRRTRTVDEQSSREDTKRTEKIRELETPLGRTGPPIEKPSTSLPSRLAIVR